MLQGRHEDKAAKSSTFFWHFCFSQLSPTFLHFQTSGTKYYLYWIQLHALQLKVPARSPKREAGEFSREAVGCSAQSGVTAKRGMQILELQAEKVRDVLMLLASRGTLMEDLGCPHCTELWSCPPKIPQQGQAVLSSSGPQATVFGSPFTRWTLKRGFVFYCILTDGSLCTDVLFRSSDPSLEEQWRQERKKGKNNWLRGGRQKKLIYEIL